MTRDRSSRPPGKRTDVDLLEGVMPPASWSQIAAVWLGWTSWEPWRAIYGVDLQKNIKKMREEAENAAKWWVEGKTIGCAGIYRAQNIRHFAAAKGSSQR